MRYQNSHNTFVIVIGSLLWAAAVIKIIISPSESSLSSSKQRSLDDLGGPTRVAHHAFAPAPLGMRLELSQRALRTPSPTVTLYQSHGTSRPDTSGGLLNGCTWPFAGLNVDNTIILYIAFRNILRWLVSYMTSTPSRQALIFVLRLFALAWLIYKHWEKTFFFMLQWAAEEVMERSNDKMVSQIKSLEEQNALLLQRESFTHDYPEPYH